MKFVCQISYPLRMVQVWVAIYVLKIWLQPSFEISIWSHIKHLRYLSNWCFFGPQPQPYQPLLGQRKKFETCVSARVVLKKFSPFCSASPEKIGVKVCNRWTDGQILWHYIRGNVDFFLWVKFATSLLALLAGGKFWIIKGNQVYLQVPNKVELRPSEFLQIHDLNVPKPFELASCKK